MPNKNTCHSKILELRGFFTIKEIVEITGYDKSLVCKVVNLYPYPYTMLKINSRYEKLVALFPELQGCKNFPYDDYKEYLSSSSSQGKKE